MRVPPIWFFLAICAAGALVTALHLPVGGILP